MNTETFYFTVDIHNGTIIKRTCAPDKLDEGIKNFERACPGILIFRDYKSALDCAKKSVCLNLEKKYAALDEPTGTVCFTIDTYNQIIYKKHLLGKDFAECRERYPSLSLHETFEKALDYLTGYIHTELYNKYKHIKD
jgi:hypothetical protein